MLPAVPLPSSLPPPEDDEGAPPWPARPDDLDDTLPLPPLEGDDEPPEGPEPGLPPDAHDPGLDDAVADDLPVGTSIDAIDAPPLGDDDALGTNGEGDDTLGDAPPPLTDEGEGFEDKSEGGLPDDDHARPIEDDGGEGLGHVSDGLEVDPLPDLDPDDESGPLGEPPVLPARRGLFARPGAARAARASGHLAGLVS